MSDLDDARRLVRAAAGAARKLKVEYDRVGERGGSVPPVDECWAECEALWYALRPFGFYLEGGQLIDGRLCRLRATQALTDPDGDDADDEFPF